MMLSESCHEYGKTRKIIVTFGVILSDKMSSQSYASATVTRFQVPGLSQPGMGIVIWIQKASKKWSTPMAKQNFKTPWNIYLR